VIFEELLQVLDPEPHGGAFNMALDEVLLSASTQPLLRVYGWARPAASFGYFGRIADVRRLHPERELVRRWTGGGVVPHGADLTYTLIVPRTVPFASCAAGESYRRIHEAVMDAIRTKSGVLKLAAGRAKHSDECFANPAAYDVMAGEQKIAGAAQRRTRHGLLHQGSIQQVGLQEEFGRIFAARLAARSSSRRVSIAEIIQGEQVAREKYASRAWLERY
jgi:lipoate-protein ligase A